MFLVFQNLILFLIRISHFGMILALEIFFKINVLMQDGNSEVEDITWYGKDCWCLNLHCRCSHNSILQGSPFAALVTSSPFRKPYQPRTSVSRQLWCNLGEGMLTHAHVQHFLGLVACIAGTLFYHTCIYSLFGC